MTAILLLALLAGDDPPRIVLRTTCGDLVLALDPALAPRCVPRIARLAAVGVYDGTALVRVDPGYLVQFAGHHRRRGPLSAEQQAEIQDLPLEAAGRHVRGAVTLAREEDGAAQTSFSILLGDAPHLDGLYTVVGRLEHGWEVLQTLASVRVFPGRPTGVWIESAWVSDGPVDPATLEGPFPAPFPSRTPSVPRSVALAGAALSVAGLLMHLGARRVGRRGWATAGLGMLLGGFFPLFAAAVPAARDADSRWPALALFLATVAMFRLLGGFETSGSATGLATKARRHEEKKEEGQGTAGGAIPGV
ncbi:MAG TPA: peptidylprolyl isomerase [Planctomycetota bacterium]|nr:peptidylprolyl isomerase [Planctomycetota bacterium]